MFCNFYQAFNIFCNFGHKFVFEVVFSLWNFVEVQIRSVINYNICILSRKFKRLHLPRGGGEYNLPGLSGYGEVVKNLPCEVGWCPVLV